MLSLTTLASTISFAHNIPQFLKVYNTQDVSSYSKDALLIGIASTLIWIIYYVINKHHVASIVTVLTLLIDLYVLYLIIQNERNGQQDSE